jgi:DNA (cytosine-5)-methyltransferase 1
MEGGQLDAAPIWTDLRSFPWAEFSDRVDILSGGYPCQPFSAAGKRLGAEDERHLWPAIADGIRILRPRICFFENVEGHISLGLREVIEELEGLGYRTAWGIFSAAEVGAPHQRKRVFIMAHRKGEGLEGHRGLLARCSEPRWHAPQSQGQIDGGDSGGDAWPSRPGEPQYWWEPPRVVADTGRDQRERRSAVGEVSCEHDGAQGAGEESDCRGQDEAGEWEESESGGIGSEPAVGDTERRQAEPEVGGGVDGPADWVGYGELCVSSDNRTDELRMLGNGVVPATAARAFVTLMEELL